MIALIAGFLDSDEGTNVESDDASAYGKLWSRCSRSRHFRCVFCPLRHTPSKERLGEVGSEIRPTGMCYCLSCCVVRAVVGRTNAPLAPTADLRVWFYNAIVTGLVWVVGDSLIFYQLPSGRMPIKNREDGRTWVLGREFESHHPSRISLITLSPGNIWH